MAFDLIELEILNRKFAAVTDEMYYAIQRASRSTFVKEAADFAAALLDADGNLFAYPPAATFAFLIDSNYRVAIDAVPNLEEGDVIITNDAYTSGAVSTHLPDINLIEPYFVDGKIVAYGWTFLHATDVGGAVAGSTSASMRSIHEEGLRIPPMKLMKKGVLNEDLIAMIHANTRMGELTVGDIRAMTGALGTGKRRVQELTAKIGSGKLIAAQKALQDYSAAKTREVLRRIPDGSYEFWEYMDSDTTSSIPVRVRVKMDVEDGKVHFDLSGTDPVVKTALNVPLMGMRNYWLTFRLTTIITTYDATVPHNSGMYRDVTATIPSGSIFDARYPDAINIRSTAPRRFCDAVTGAIMKAAPDLVTAPAGGTGLTMSFSEPGPDGMSRVVEIVEPMRAGMGARKGHDGTDVRDNSMNNMRNHPLETVEGSSSVRILRYDAAQDSGGPGKWRGGMGQMLVVEVLCDNGYFLAAGIDRMRFRPWGIFGGYPARGLKLIYNQGRPDEREIIRIHELAMKKGDTLTILMPGGGGYGNPLERDPEAVLRDVEIGYVSLKSAQEDYGVVIVDGKLDEKATAELRASRASIERPEFDFGPERAIWESVFDDATMFAINEQLYRLPKSQRQDVRTDFFEKVVPGISVLTDKSFAELIPDPEAARARLKVALADLTARAAAFN